MDWDKVWEFFHGFKANRVWALVLMVPNLIGIGYGYYFYYDVGQFPNPLLPQYGRPWWWWPFIPDSPNAVLLVSISLLAFAFWGKRSKVFDAIAFTAMIYVGLWTTMMFLSYPELGAYKLGTTNNLLFFSHMGMPLEALILVRDMRRDVLGWFIKSAVIAWNALNLYLDYWGPHLHPAPFLHDSAHLPPASSVADTALHAASPWIMAFTIVVWLWVAQRQRPAAPTAL